MGVVSFVQRDSPSFTSILSLSTAVKMAKKKSDKQIAPPSPARAKTETTPSKKKITTAHGLLVLCAAVSFSLSLLSFTYGHDAHNWLGLTGYAAGKVFHSLFGVGSYIFCIYLFWIGWRLLFSKSINDLGAKTASLWLIVTSFCFLACLIEDRFSSIGTMIGNFFYSNFAQKKKSYHLGGIPFYYLYRDLPSFNLFRLFNTIGIIIIFSSTFIAGILLLTKEIPLPNR